MELKPKLSIKDAVQYAWHTVTNDLLFFTKLRLVMWVMKAILFCAPGFLLVSQFKTFSLVLLILCSPLLFLIYFLTTYFELKVLLSVYAKGSQNTSLEEGFEVVRGKTILRLIGCSLLLFIVFAVGFALLLVPGIYLMIKLQFAPYFIIDKQESIINAIKKSFTITNYHFLPLAIIYGFAYLLLHATTHTFSALVISLINPANNPLSFIQLPLSASLIISIIGMILSIITIPMAWLIMIYAYKHLLAFKQMEAE